MKCRICGFECPPGAKLCRDCAAARKRAFAATVTVPLLAAAGGHSVSARFAPKPLRSAKPSKEPVQSPASRAVRRGQQPGARPAVATAREAPTRLRVAAVSGALVLVAAIAFLEFRTFAGGHGRSSGVPEMPAPETPRVLVPAKPLQLMPVRREAAAAGEGASIAASSSADAGKAVEAPVQGAPPRPPARKRVPSPAALKASPPAVPPAAVEEPARVVAAPVRLVEAVHNDPLQKLTGALARCAREDIVARLGCEQRVRVQYCGDSWGQTPQCAIGRSTDHGQ